MKAVHIRTAGRDPYNSENRDLYVSDFVYVPGKIVFKGFMNLLHRRGSIIDYSDEEHVQSAEAILNGSPGEMDGSVVHDFELLGADVARIVKVMPGHVKTKFEYEGSTNGLVDILTGRNLRRIPVISNLYDFILRKFG